MTLEQAREILKNYHLPMTPQELALYKQALKLVSTNFGRPPQG